MWPTVRANDRGGIWVAGQVVLLGAFAIVAPITAGSGSAALLHGTALALAGLGVLVALWAALKLGRGLTPFPKPIENARLCREGPYRWVRHPIYLGVLLIALAWAAWWQSATAALLSPPLLGFFALKARAEERWLRAAWPEYLDYSRHVKAIIPFIY